MTELVWHEHPEHKFIYAESVTQRNGKFRIFYDDVMYYPSWSPEFSQDLDSWKKEAQLIHDLHCVVDNISE